MVLKVFSSRCYPANDLVETKVPKLNVVGTHVHPRHIELLSSRPAPPIYRLHSSVPSEAARLS